MKFHDLHIENFLTLRNASVNLADRGLQLIQGVNEDDSSATSNGAGKSSMVDAICWCLYGVTARDVKGDAVVNLGAKKDCRVSLIMSNGATEYKVTRHRKHATGKNSLVVEVRADPDTAVGVDLSRGTDAETQKVLEKIIGCSHEVFMAAVYSGQEAMPDLPKMKDRELKTLIEEAAGLQRIESAYGVARERLNSAKNSAATCTDKVDNLKVTLARATNAFTEMMDKADKWDVEKAARVGASEATHLLALTDLDIARAAAVSHESAATDADVQVAVIDEKLAAHERLQGAAVKAERNVRTAEMAIDAGLLKRLAADIEFYKTRIANAAEEIKKPCTQCGTALESMSVEDFVTHETKHLDAAKLKLEEGKVKARTQVANLLALRSDATVARAAVPDVTALVARRLEERATIRVWADADREVARRAADVKAAEDQLTLRKTEPNPHQSAKDMCEKQVREAIASLAAAETKLTVELQALEIATAVAKVFGPAGVRAQILDTVTPFLNERTADYLSCLTDGNAHATWTTLTKDSKGDLKEKFTIDVTHDKGGDSFAAISGGEKRKVRLATALALQDLMASRASQPIDLWVGDEVDDALDPAGLERLMTILERKARERGTVLVISHSDLKDWCDNVTTVRKAEQWHSTIEGALCS